MLQSFRDFARLPHTPTTLRLPVATVFLVAMMYVGSTPLCANSIVATPNDYLSKVSVLSANDTLLFTAGIYTNGLTLTNLNGTETQPIVIMGMDTATVFVSRSCCNTVSITQCSYVVISHFRVEGAGAGVDALKAEGTTGNWAHHITVEYLTITNFQSDQQVVGINTKCPCWNWVIRKNRILGAGTGLYLGNSNGDAPFVNGDIEYNYVSGTLGYCMEIKHQLTGVRDSYAGTAVDGKTIIAHNVFTKDSTSSTGSLARPNLLVGGFAASGWGSKDYYEIVGNLLYENSTEALFQGSGSLVMYNNIFINHSDGDGARAVYITSQNNIPPENVLIFHNTVVANNSNGGIRLYNADSKYDQRCFANAVFAANPITNVTLSYDNVTDSYAKAPSYLLSWDSDISHIDCVPQANTLIGSSVDDSLIKNYAMAARDFSGAPFDLHYRGAYSECCTPSSWHLKLDTMTEVPGLVNGIAPAAEYRPVAGRCVSSRTILKAAWPGPTRWRVYDYTGLCTVDVSAQDASTFHLPTLTAGCYSVQQSNLRGVCTEQILYAP